MKKINYFQESTKEYRLLRKANNNEKPDLLFHGTISGYKKAIVRLASGSAIDLFKE